MKSLLKPSNELQIELLKYKLSHYLYTRESSGTLVQKMDLGDA